ncbi:hypothetical protein EIP86_003166 [Pleurotus ostreatoroseus]|nr:hypothetical protein EIP86_003166 [Pleurotus ostreatoroseus]
MRHGRKRAFTRLEELVIEEEELSHAFSTVVSDTVSADGRRVKRTTHSILTPISPPKKRTRRADLELHEPDEDVSISLEHEDGLFDDITIQIEPPKHKKRRNNRYFVSTVCTILWYAGWTNLAFKQEHDAFLSEWVDQRDRFLDELLRLEGLRDVKTVCAGCQVDVSAAAVRCKDCSGGQLFCASCCVSAHERLPFHVVEEWNGRHFARASLQKLGLVLQLGHIPGDVCSSPSRSPVDFMVMHTNGHHNVTISFCHCDQMGKAGDDIQQMLRYELFPATVVGPSTCATFRLLETFHLLTLQSKTTPYDFYLTLNHLSDNTGLHIKWDRFKQFLRLVREWAHLKALKRAGRGQEPGGPTATRSGELCLICPACPRSGFNLPDDWEDTPADLRRV